MELLTYLLGWLIGYSVNETVIMETDSGVL